MKRFLVVALTAVFAIQPFDLSSQIYNGTPGNMEFLTFLGGSGVNSTWGPQVGPYTASFASDPGNPFSIYCVDYLHYAASHDVNLTSLASGSNLANTRVQDFGKYGRAAYLSSLFESWENYSDVAGYTGLSQQTVWSGIHAAIWGTTSGVTEGGATGATADLRTYFAALTIPGSFSTDGWYVVTGKTLGTRDYDGTGQEFLIRTSGLPEPSTYLLMMTGMLLFGFVAHKRRLGLARAA